MQQMQLERNRCNNSNARAWHEITLRNSRYTSVQEDERCIPKGMLDQGVGQQHSNLIKYMYEYSELSCFGMFRIERVAYLCRYDLMLRIYAAKLCRTFMP